MDAGKEKTGNIKRKSCWVGSATRTLKHSNPFTATHDGCATGNASYASACRLASAVCRGPQQIWRMPRPCPWIEYFHTGCDKLSVKWYSGTDSALTINAARAWSARRPIAPARPAPRSGTISAAHLRPLNPILRHRPSLPRRHAAVQTKSSVVDSASAKPDSSA